MTRSSFLLLNLALAFYNVGTIWAHELDIFRSWRLVDPSSFHAMQQAHWRKLPYWVLTPVALALAGTVALLWYRPPNVSLIPIAAALCFQLASAILTALFWGPWQAKLSRDDRDSQSPYLHQILETHWLRTALITASGLSILWATLKFFD